jgi:hypothetical protein
LALAETAVELCIDWPLEAMAGHVMINAATADHRSKIGFVMA